MLINAGAFGGDGFPFYFSMRTRSLVASDVRRAIALLATPTLIDGGSVMSNFRDLHHERRMDIESMV